MRSKFKFESNKKFQGIFGVPLVRNVQKYGEPLPQCIQYALQYLRRTSMKQQGLFRKSGVKTRIAKLRDFCETNPEGADFCEYRENSPYDVADLVKMYLRELPEPLMTLRLSSTFTTIFIDVPPQYRLRALQSAILLLPDENREVLQTLLYFLSDIAANKDCNQMPASNLAVCFAPSLFQIAGASAKFKFRTALSRRHSIDIKKVGQRDEKDIVESVAAHQCLTFMIKECKKLFKVPFDMMNGLGQHEDCLVNDFGLNPQVVFDHNTQAVGMNPISA